MHFKQLEVFVQVARLGSFSKAADTLYLTQPTVSAHIRTLEEELGTPLVKRSTRSTSLTTAGQVLFGHATRILADCQRAEQEVRSSVAQARGTLTIAASTVPSQYLLPKLLPTLRQRCPHVFFQVIQSDSAQVARTLFEGGAELGVMGAPVHRAGYECLPFFREWLVVVTPNTPPYQGLDEQGLHRLLAHAPYLVREPGSGTRRQSEEFLRGTGIDPKHLTLAAQFQSTESILQAVKNGLGISIVSGLAAEEGAAAGRLLAYPCQSPLLEREFFLLYPKNCVLSPAAQLLLRELPRVCGENLT